MTLALLTCQRRNQGKFLVLGLSSQYTIKIRKMPRKVPDGTFWRKSIAFAATEEMNPPLSLPKMILKSTHKTTSRNATSTMNQPIFVICRITFAWETPGRTAPARVSPPKR